MSLEFRFANNGEYPRIIAFIDEFWAKNHIFVRSKELFDWTFKRPGFWEGDGYSFALGEDNGDLMGILGGVPYNFNAYGKIRRGVWIMNYAIRPDHRKGTAALKLLSTFRNPSFPVVIASGLNPATTAIYKVLRGQVLTSPPRHVIVMPGAAGRMAELIRTANPEWEAGRALAVAEAFQLPSLVEPVAEAGSKFPAQWDEVDWSILAATTVGAVRDLEYLNWRYCMHPCFEYHIIAIPEGDRTGLLIWRLETVRQETENGRKDLDRFGRVVEFIPTSDANGRQLMAALTSQLKAADAVGADFFGYHGNVRRVLSATGMPATAQHADGPAIPFLFQPIAPSGPLVNAMFSDPDLPPCDSRDDCAWYWTKSDSDQDRPN